MQARPEVLPKQPVGGHLRKTIVVKATMRCNLRCLYCYEARLHGDAHPDENLSTGTILNFIQRCARLFTKSEILWLLHGGEPLLNGTASFDHIAGAVRDANQQHGVHFRIALQTNGTLLNDEWVEAFHRNADVFGERIISVSIDGPEALEGAVRVDGGGRTAHASIVDAIQRIGRSHLDFTTISVVGAHNVREPDVVYNSIKALNPNFAKFIPCYNLDDNGEPEQYGIKPLAYAKFMCRIFDLWLADLPAKTDDRFVIDPILSIVSQISGAPVSWCEYRTEKCDNFASLYPNGELWLCDAYDHELMRGEACLGNIQSLDDETLQRAFLRPSEVCEYQPYYDGQMNECLECDVFPVCNGGCLEKRHSIRMRSADRYAEYCEGKRLLISHIQRAVADALS